MIKLKEREKRKIQIYKRLFKGRSEIFVKRWEKAEKSSSGYTPVCLNEWKKGVCIKLDKKKCKDCSSQKYPTFDNNYLVKHLLGNETYGIYPFSFTSKLTEYIGRIQRGDDKENIIYDYRDSKIDYLNRFYKKRLRYYKKHNVLEGQLNV